MRRNSPKHSQVERDEGEAFLEPIVLLGPLDQYAAEELKAQALPLLKAEGNPIFDFSDVDRMHAASLQVLLALGKELEPKGRRVEIIHVGDRVRDLFRISGTEDIFTFSGSAE